MLRSELQKIGESLQSAERACCHSTGAGKLREALGVCDDILARQVMCLLWCGLHGGEGCFAIITATKVLAAASKNDLFAGTYFVKGALWLIFFNG